MVVCVLIKALYIGSCRVEWYKSVAPTRSLIELAPNLLGLGLSLGFGFHPKP